MIYLTLFYEFFKTGLFAIGGGLATLPFLYDMAERTALITAADVSNMIAVSEATPGPVGINAATYFGYQLGGVAGSLVATLGIITPSIIVILIISRVLAHYRDNRFVAYGMHGLRPASVALIAAAGWGVARTALFYTAVFETVGFSWDIFNLPAIILTVLIFAAMKKFKGHPVFYLAVAAIFGIVFKM